MIRFFAQPKYSITTVKLVGYELFIREQATVGEDWRLPADFSQFKPQQIIHLLAETLKTFPQGLSCISFNLDQEQFVDLNYCRLLKTLQAQTPIRLYVELTERQGKGTASTTLQELVHAAQAYQQAGLAVCLDDVGTGTNQYELVRTMAAYTVEYKYALQNVRGRLPGDEIHTQIKFWREMALRQQKTFALEGFEYDTDNSLIAAFHPDIVQGYYFGQPHILPIAADFN
ncbi:EAL domain-containing protein [Loigolactobacillus bifermentans]|uniref:C-di-GMP-specific phosphodiesterase n=1 Tax=Loigolactobacillus bifermentans DSM 20003 TaxID=1423726 RepID=A0A0R1GMQ3_9LACO|nr:EAL domain-containing protein [Loigolactobacillus bifermentans]KRK32578.1 C-di-GMP-specific phosphodiesterase [Loigolactobacillus bifermentans DSM 20003]QGG60248.1 EAL domain-containing protein [Loigolactobacillus bifermentans]